MAQDNMDEALVVSEQLHAQYDRKTAVVDYLFRNFIKGRYKRIQDFKQELSEVGIEISNRYVFAAVASYESLEALKVQELLEMFFLCSSDELEIFGDEGIENNRLVFIFAARDDEVESTKDMLSRVIDGVSTQTGLKLFFGFGRIFDDVSMLNQSYQEAALALEYSIIKNKIITHISEINEMSQLHVDYPTESIQQFELALFRGDYAASERELSALVEFMKSREAPLLIIHSLKCDLLRIVNRQSANLGIDDGLPLSDIKDINEYYHTIIHQIQKNFDYRAGRDISENSRKLAVFQEYINENYLDSNLSLNMMADAFGMSVSNLSHFFRNHATETFSATVQRKRMETAKGLLAGNAMCIQDIATHCGYANRTSFMKRFKSLTGMSAGEYREMMRRKNKNHQ